MDFVICLVLEVDARTPLMAAMNCMNFAMMIILKVHAKEHVIQKIALETPQVS